MHIVHSTFLVPAEKANEVIDIYRKRSKLVDKNPGFVRFILLQNDKNKGEITVHMEWETKEDYLSWVRGIEFKKIHELEKKYPDQELASVVPIVKQFSIVAE